MARSVTALHRIPGAAAWAAFELRLHTLRRFTEILEDEGIPSVPIKGVCLAPRLYASPEERPLVDVDLLVRPHEFGRLVRIARSHGFPLVWDSKQLGNVNVVVEGTTIDIATSLGPPGTAAIGVSTLLDRATRATDPLGFPHWQIELHDHVLVVAIDAFKDKLGSKPSSREDLLRCAKLPGFEPKRLVEVAREARLETLVAIVAAWVREVEPTSPWQTVLAELSDARLHGLYARAFRRWSERRESRLYRLPLALLARAASDVPVRRLLALALGGIGTLAFLVHNRGLAVKVEAMPRRAS